MKKFTHILAIAAMATLCTIQINATKPAATLSITKPTNTSLKTYALTGSKIATEAAAITVVTLASIYLATNTRRNLSAFTTWAANGVKKALTYSPIHAPTSPTRQVNKDNDMTNAFGKPTEPTINQTCAAICPRQINNAWNNIVHSNKTPEAPTPVTPEQEKNLINKYVKNFDRKEALSLFPQKYTPAHTIAEQNCKTAGILDKCQDAMDNIFEKEAEQQRAQEDAKLAVKCEQDNCYDIPHQTPECTKNGCYVSDVFKSYTKNVFAKHKIEQEEKRLKNMQIKKQKDLAFNACHAPIIESEACKKMHWTVKEINGCDAAKYAQENIQEKNCNELKYLNREYPNISRTFPEDTPKKNDDTKEEITVTGN